MLAARRKRTDAFFAARPSGTSREEIAVDVDNEVTRTRVPASSLLPKRIAERMHTKREGKHPLPDFQRAISDGGSDLLSNNQLLVLL